MVRGRNGGCSKNPLPIMVVALCIKLAQFRRSAVSLEVDAKNVPNVPPRPMRDASDGAGSTSSGSLAASPNNAWTFSGKRVPSPAGGGVSLDSMPAATVSACAVAAAAEAIATSASVAGCIKMLTSPRTQSVRALTKAHVASYVLALLNCITVLSLSHADTKVYATAVHEAIDGELRFLVSAFPQDRP